MVLAVVAGGSAALTVVLEGCAVLAGWSAGWVLSHASGTAAIPESVLALPASKGHSQ